MRAACGVAEAASCGEACPWESRGSQPVTRLVPDQIVQRICRYFAGHTQATGVPCPYTDDCFLSGNIRSHLMPDPGHNPQAKNHRRLFLGRCSARRGAYGSVTKECLGWGRCHDQGQKGYRGYVIMRIPHGSSQRVSSYQPRHTQLCGENGNSPEHRR
jgi:hypothetical protein